MSIYKLEIISTKRKYSDNSNLKKRTSSYEEFIQVFRDT